MRHLSPSRLRRAIAQLTGLPALPLACAALVLLAVPAATAQRATPDGFHNKNGKDAERKARPPGHLPGKRLDIGPNGPPDNTAPELDDDEAAKKAERRALLRRPGQRLPDDPAQRDKLLAELYGHLAKATTEGVAKRIASSIERVWLHSGSDTVGLLMSRALLAIKHNKRRSALKSLNDVVVIAPDFAEGWNQRAYVYFKQNDMARALGDLRRVLALDPRHFKALEGLGQIMKEIEEKRAALKVFKKLLRVHPFASGVAKIIDQLEREVGGQET